MRCHDVKRELGAPSGAVSQGLLAAHLATCPKCAELAARAERFDRAWGATRPEEPAVFETVWAKVRRRFEAPVTAGAARPSIVQSWRPWVLGITGLAQVAALVVLGVVLLRHPERLARQKGNQPAQAGAAVEAVAQGAVAVSICRIDLEPSEGRIPVIPVGECRAESLPAQEMINPTMVAFNFELLNLAESMAQQ